MSNERQETIADIVAAMRKDIAEGTVGIWSDFGGEIARSYADRIEAAHKREREATTDESSAVGKVAQEMLNTSMQAVTAERINEWATRLAEACEQPVTDCNQLGNAAAMREALEQIHELLSIGGNPDTAMCIRYEAAYQIAAEALSAPPRNCDIGTAEEQCARIRAFCERHKEDCPTNDVLQKNCALIWAQMPYEEGGAK